ncbi:MAG: alpha/beta hydrolase [Chloroflexota bacterium]|nr:alpha/beta hydrolase [Chloroflexota bacterium]
MEAQIEYVGVSGAELWTSRQGCGPALVLCHGGPGMWDYLGPVAEMVDDLATVYRYDQRGCGRSSGGPPFDVATAVADLEELREHWRLPRWVVAGHSWGATLALAYCLTHPDRATALVYISGTGIDPSWHAEYKANQAVRFGRDGQSRLAELKERLGRAQGPEFAAVSRELCELAYATDIADQGRARELARALFVDDIHPNYELNRLLGKDARHFAENESMPERLTALRVPALVVHGDADPRPVWAARKVAGLLPNARLVTLPGVGHCPWLERPELLREALRGVLTGV